MGLSSEFREPSVLQLRVTNTSKMASCVSHMMTMINLVLPRCIWYSEGASFVKKKRATCCPEGTERKQFVRTVSNGHQENAEQREGEGEREVYGMWCLVCV